jgi:hypothetical protein
MVGRRPSGVMSSVASVIAVVVIAADRAAEALEVGFAYLPCLGRMGVHLTSHTSITSALHEVESLARPVNGITTVI